MMPTYSMTDLERLATGVSTSRRQTDSGTLQRLPVKPDVRRDIYTAVMMAGEPVKRAQIAALLGLKKTPWLCAAIEQLVTAGYLLKQAQERPNQLPTYFYSIAAAMPAKPAQNASEGYWGKLPEWMAEN